MVQMQTQLIGTGHQVLFGDSNTEAFWWSTVGGCNILNAGMGGSTIHDLATRIDGLAATTGPRIAHVMTGTNDGPPTAATRADMVTIVQTLRSHGATVVVWPIPSSGTNSTAAINAMWADVAGTYGALWDWWWPSQVTLNPDNIHLTPSAQIARYYRIDVWRQYLLNTYGVNGC